jgi:hypothetical protein
MILRASIAGLSLAGATLVPLAGPAIAQGDRDCSDFKTQAEAQSALRPGDPEHLDRDKDGIACENLPKGTPSPAQQQVPGSASTPSPGQVASEPRGGNDAATPPSGGVETGFGGTATGPDDNVIILMTLTGAAATITGTALIVSHNNRTRRGRNGHFL